MSRPESGDRAPAFSLQTDNGESVTLADFAGRALILYFYPKDDTPGCTKEAIGFTEQIQAFADAGAAVLGVSRDSTAKHAKFRDKHSLKVLLGADEDGTVCEAYGVWVEKAMYGRTYMGIERSTFLIDGNGIIHDVWRKVRVPGHVDAVLERVRAL